MQRTVLKTVQVRVTITQQGQSVRRHIQVPKNVTKIHCILSNTTFPILGAENILLQEDFNSILTEDGNNILIE